MVLADIGDIQIARQAVETESPGIAQAQRPEFRAPLGPVHPGIVGGNPVRKPVNVDSEQLAQEFVGILCPILRIATAAAIAHADIQEAIGTELQLSLIHISA